MTSEYVTLGHPDKIADYISEYILDEYMKYDRNTRYAVEVQIKDNWVSLAGEITSKHHFTSMEHAQFVRAAIDDIGYTPKYAALWPNGATLDSSKVEVVEHISQQSNDIAQGVDNDGWGDQGIFWGMATNNKQYDYIPLDYWYARKIANHLYKYRFGGLDIKTQVTIDNGSAVKCIVAIPILPKYALSALGTIKSYVQSILGAKCDVIINGTGSYVVHSSMGDCGTTGRKLVVDFYGGNCRIGGGSPWTKDPSKADLTLNVYARHIAKDYVKHHNIDKCYVAINCCIGQKDIGIEVYDSHNVCIDKWVECKKPSDVIIETGLDKACFKDLCKNGLTYG